MGFPSADNWEGVDRAEELEKVECPEKGCMASRYDLFVAEDLNASTKSSGGVDKRIMIVHNGMQ